MYAAVPMIKSILAHPYSYLQQAVGAPKNRIPDPSSDVQCCLGGLLLASVR
jgi:hypothetical protein